MANLKSLQKAAAELNSVLGLDPAINVKSDESTLTELVIEAIDLVNPDEDEFSEAVQKTIDELKPARSKKGKGKAVPVEEDEEDDDEPVATPKKGKDKPAPEPDPEDDDTPEAEDEDEMSLQEQVENATTVAELKAIVKANDEFVSLRKAINGKFNLDDLMADMLAILNPPKKGKDKPAPVEEEEDEDKPAPKKGKTDSPKTKSAAGEKVTKKAVIEEMLATKKGATIEEMAAEIVARKIDKDLDKNMVVVKLWLSKMGYNTKKDVIAKNPVFKAK